MAVISGLIPLWKLMRNCHIRPLRALEWVLPASKACLKACLFCPFQSIFDLVKLSLHSYLNTTGPYRALGGDVGL